MESTNAKEFPVYGALSEDEYTEKTNDLLGRLQKWYVDDGCDWSNIQYSKERLRQVIDMVERRRTYFHVFHCGMEMGELNEACLRSFWILKRYPFFDVKHPNRDVNLFFALVIFTYGVSFTADKRAPKEKPNFGQHIIEHLEHAFKFRDLSKEAMMAIAEGLIVADAS